MVGDDAEVLIAVFETFLTQLPVYLEELDQALVYEDWDKVARYAHKIKPVFTYIGCNDVRDLVQGIEQKAQNRTTLASIQTDITTLKARSATINRTN
ncbi:Hpt domain-containing protein [Pedobacter sp. HDW13]|uniref:Hpt domain-containing protein n=1 Tax=unclassified Pedobacter TaxID=2628915 RepID=UPI000F5A3346|nr:MULTISPECIES: Hpt domain-containing protein [unclassified Pedobacter]QIL41181.1 Hpt domain-containing protein [Pedobacter sp. HDW13]RQO77044.1 histidine phosphotransferase [Pedobacter sp. KBW01]